jgi:CRISPR type IV-associated protein Csf3
MKDYKNFKVEFNLDSGMYFSLDPIHLDSLLVFSQSIEDKNYIEIDQDDEIQVVELPLSRTEIDGIWFWSASALFPKDEKIIETLRFYRKKFRQNRIHLTNGAPNLVQGTYREYNMPVPISLVDCFYAYGHGDMERVLYLLRKNITSLGKKRSYGYGKISSIEIFEEKEDFSLVKDGMAMRYLPDSESSRFVRPRPPYWNSTERVNCCEVGDEYNAENFKRI